MKLTITRIELVRAIAAVKPVANGTLPILSNLLLVANEKSVTLTACDGDLHLRVKAGATVAEPGRTTLRAGLLHEIARNATGEAVSLHLVRNTLHVECGTVRFKLATVDADDFPPFPRLKDAAGFALKQADFRSMLSRTAFATSRDEERIVFNGSLISLNGRLNVAACDGRRLGLVEAPPPDAGEDMKLDKFDLILPAKAVRELLRLLGTGEDAGKVAVAATKNLAQFTLGDVTVLSALIGGDYPDFRKIIPKSDTPVASIQRIDLLHAVELVALVADAVKLDFRKQNLLISSARVTGDKKDSFGDASDNLLCAAARELSIKLSAEYLRDALNACTADEVQFFANADGTIALLRSPSENWLSVIAALNDAPAEAPKAPAKPEAKPAEARK